RDCRPCSERASIVARAGSRYASFFSSGSVREIEMQRRRFIGLLVGATNWPLVVGAQQTKRPVIGFLGATSAGPSADVVAFQRGLSEAGFVDGQNLSIEYRWAEGRYE